MTFFVLTKIGFISFKRKPGVPGLFLVLHDVLVFSRLEAFVDGHALDDELHDLLGLGDEVVLLGVEDVLEEAVEEPVEEIAEGATEEAEEIAEEAVEEVTE